MYLNVNFDFVHSIVKESIVCFCLFSTGAQRCPLMPLSHVDDAT